MMNSVGKERRLARLFSHQSGKMVLVPLDDSLLAGPTNGLETLSTKIAKIASSSPNAVMGFQGLLKNYSNLIGQVPTILNLTASTTNITHTKKVLVGSLELAVMLDVQAVAVHVNISSRYESSMLKDFGNIAMECDKLGIPLMGIMYPRKENEDGTDNNYLDLKSTDRLKYVKLVAHAARVGFELGADIIKTQYTGDFESFRAVTEACKPLPVLVAGGLPVDILEMLEIAEGAIKGGARGISFGRNIFTRDDPQYYIQAIQKIVHEDCSSKQAFAFFQSLNNQKNENKLQ
jgi:fructose-bisphosphate aldolase/2-amino-3,7-dideoxy-D-threo-hept-6-ulosonate synthase